MDDLRQVVQAHLAKPFKRRCQLWRILGRRMRRGQELRALRLLRPAAFVRQTRVCFYRPHECCCRIGAMAAGSTRGQEPHRRQQRSGRQQHEPRHGRPRGDLGHRDKRACIPEKMQYENLFQKTRFRVCTFKAGAALEATAACQLCAMPRR